MIWESAYWKEPLLDSATWLRRFRFRPQTREQTLVRLEKEVMIGFYSVRKLLDTVKVSDSTKSRQYDLEIFESKGTDINDLNWHHIDRHYKLEKGRSECRKIRFICDLFIHSYVFLTNGAEKLEGIYVTTDRFRKVKLYHVTTDQIVQIFRLVGKDFPANGAWIRNPATSELQGSAW